MRDGRDTRLGGTLVVSTDYYNPAYKAQLGALGVKFVALNFQVSAADPKAWDAIWAELQGKLIPGGSVFFTGWQWTKDALAAAAGKIVFTVSHDPAIEDVRAADALASATEDMIAYYKRIVPEQAGAINAAKADAESRLAHLSLPQNPDAVWWDTFWDEIKNKVGGGGGIGIGIILLALGAAFVFGRMR